MTTTYPCPVCGAPADLTAGCGGCGRSPDAQAAEVVRLNEELAALAPEVDEAQRAYTALAARLRETRQRRDDLALAVRQAAFYARGGVAPQVPATTPAPTGQPPAPATQPAPPAPEAKPVTVQNLLFVLGGLLVGAAAIVFTGVAWATYGPVGRSVALAAVTLLALAVPPLATRRGLRATAETFAAVGMLLVVLDGYGAWYVNLLGLGNLPGAGYAAIVCVVTAAVALGYGAATGLAGPRFAALVAIQPALPLVAAEVEADAWGWSIAFGAVAAVDLLVVARVKALGPRVVAWVAYGCALLASGACALVALLGPDPARLPVLLGLPLLLTTALILAAGLVTRLGPLRTVGTAALAFAAALAVVRPVAEVSVEQTDLAATVAVLALAAMAYGLGRLAGPGLRAEALGARIGAGVAAAVWGFVLLILGAIAIGVTVAGSFPVWHSSGPAVRVYAWENPLWVAGVTAAAALLLPAAARRIALVAGGTLIALTLPVALLPDIWLIVTVDLVVAALLLLVVRRFAPVPAEVAAAVLAAHAAVVSLATPAAAAAVSAAILVLGLAGGLVLRGTVAGRVALAVGLVAWPAAVAATVFAAGAPDPWTARAGLTAAALLLIPVVVLAGRAARPYALGALALAVGVATIWPDLTDVGEPQGVYPALGLVILATAYRAVRPHGWQLLGAAAIAASAVLLIVVLPLALNVFAAPYEWVGSIWSGVPDGVGIDPGDISGIPAGSAVALLLVAVAIALIGRYADAAAVGIVGVVAVLAGLDAPWPTVPAASLALGAGAVVATALWWRGGRYVAAIGVLLAGAGLAGLLATEASTLAGLGLLAVAAAVVGGAGPATGARVAGWLVAVAAAGSFAAAATRAVDLPLARAAYPVLAVAAVALGLAALLRSPRFDRGRQSAQAASPRRPRSPGRPRRPRSPRRPGRPAQAAQAGRRQSRRPRRAGPGGGGGSSGSRWTPPPTRRRSSRCC